MNTPVQPGQSALPPAPPAPIIPHPELDRNTIEALQAVRDRLLQLRESYYFFMQAVHPDNPVPISWPDLLGKFNVLVAKHTHLRAETLRYHALLSGLALHPCEPPVNEAEAGSLPVLLRTKLLPAMEREEMAARLAMSADGADVAARMHNLEQLRRHAAEHVEQARSNVDLRMRLDPIEGETVSTSTGGNGAITATTNGETNTTTAAGKLEKLLAWMSSGSLRTKCQLTQHDNNNNSVLVMDHLLIAITTIINSIRLSTVFVRKTVFQHNSNEVPFLLNVQEMRDKIKRDPNNKKQINQVVSSIL